MLEGLIDIDLTKITILDAGSVEPPKSDKLFNYLDRDCRKIPMIFLMKVVL